MIIKELFKAQVGDYCIALNTIKCLYSTVSVFYSGQFPGDHGLVAPGMSCHYAVRFNPDSLRDFDDEIRIQTQAREPIIVPLLGRRPPPQLTCKLKLKLKRKYFY